MNEFKKNLRTSTGMRFFIYMIALLVCVLIGSGIANCLDNGDIGLLKLNQGISSMLVFVAPPLILYAFTRNRPLREIGFRCPSSYWALLVGVILMFVSLPLTNFLNALNEGMKLPESFSRLEEMLKQMEDSAADFTLQMLEVDTVWGLLVNLFVIALIPAVGEELTFRGVLQQALVKKTKNAHVGIVLSATIFSFIHFQFYGFLPRMFLGILLGYMFYYSGSLWTSILMHFINNGSVVVVAYLEHNGYITVDTEHFGATENVWLLVFSLLLTVGLIYYGKSINKRYGKQ